MTTTKSENQMRARRQQQQQRRRRINNNNSVALLLILLLVAVLSGSNNNNGTSDDSGGSRLTLFAQAQQYYDGEAWQQQQQQDDYSSTTTASERRRQRQERRQQRRQRRQSYRGDSDGGGDENYEYLKEKMQELKGLFSPNSDSSKPPSDIIQATFKALQSLLLGLGLGSASFFGIPIIGYIKVGPTGGIAGLIMGSLLTAGIAITSAISAAYHMVMGIWHTPQKLWSNVILRKTWWDATTQSYIHYSLQKEEEDLEIRKKLLREQIRNATSTTGGTGSSNKNMDLYERLGVESNASTKDIKKAYRKRARDVHPDKNPDDEEANEQFLKLYEAYRTLSDDKLRAQYDKFGSYKSSDSTSTVIPFDPSVFFVVLLDADTVEPYVGELRVSFYANKLIELAQLGQAAKKSEGTGDDDSSSNISLEQLAHLVTGWGDDSRRRNLEIAKHLVSFTQDYVDGGETNDELYEIKCQEEAQKISDSAFGRQFLQIIGTALIVEAKSVLAYSSPITFPMGLYGSVISTPIRKTKMNYKKIRKTYHVLRLLVNSTITAADSDTVDLSSMSAASARARQKRKKLKDGKHYDTEKVLKEMMPDLVDMAWTFIESDVAYAVQQSCRRFFADASSKIRRRRARAVLKLGQAMISVVEESCDSTGGGEGEAIMMDEIVKKRMERALHLAVMDVN